MKILVVSSYSGGGQATEMAVIGCDLGFHCIHDNVFETNTPKSIEEIKKQARKGKYKAIVLDNHWTPSGATAITHGQFIFAGELHNDGIEVFVLCRSLTGPSFDCELWRMYKPLAFPDMKKPVMHLARITSSSREYFNTHDGKVFTYSGGDSGQESLEHSLHNHTVFRERNWIAIKRAIITELSL